jgi:hypothetical protein
MVTSFTYAVLITQERIEDATHVNQLVPIFVRARQSAQFQPQHDSDMIEAHLRHQPLKPGAIVGRPTAQTLIFVNHDDTLSSPTQPTCEIQWLTELSALEYTMQSPGAQETTLQHYHPRRDNAQRAKRPEKRGMQKRGCHG